MPQLHLGQGWWSAAAVTQKLEGTELKLLHNVQCSRLNGFELAYSDTCEVEMDSVHALSLAADLKNS